MNRARTVVVVFALAAVSIGAASWSAERTSSPPHVAPPAAEASGPVSLAVVGGDVPQQAIDREAWIEGVARGEWFAGVELAEREAAAAREAAARAVPRSVGGGGGSGSCDLTGWTLPDEILFRESRCSEDAFNATGCGGRGCVGAAQLDLGHFANPSPWGGVGACWGLDPYSVADQQECVRRLSGDGSNLAPWRG